MSAAEQRAKVLEEKRHVSSRISDLSRYIGFALVAVVYAILTSDSAVISKLYGSRTTILLVAAAFGAVTVVLDYLQFLAGYFSVQAALRNETGAYKYNDKSISYQARSIAFWAKQAFAVVGSLIFGAAIILPLVCA